MSFEHCHFCKPPVRHAGCHSDCPYYAADIAARSAAKEEKRRLTVAKCDWLRARQFKWGCNYFDYHFAPGRIVWDKCNEGSSFSDCEIAATNCHDSVRLFRYMWNGMMQGKSIAEGFIQQGNKALNEQRIHPTQKPVALYVWLLQKYAKPGDKILDTHLGSGSSRIAALELGLDFVGYEIDERYYEAQERRFEEYASQGSLFAGGAR